jgi:hypothetical protein
MISTQLFKLLLDTYDLLDVVGFQLVYSNHMDVLGRYKTLIQELMLKPVIANNNP